MIGTSGVQIWGRQQNGTGTMMSSSGQDSHFMAARRAGAPPAASAMGKTGRGADRLRHGGPGPAALSRSAPGRSARRAAEDSALARAALTAAGDVGTWEWNATSGRLRLDGIACRMLGLPPSRRGIAGAAVLGALRPEERRRLLRVARRAAEARDGRSFTAEFRAGGDAVCDGWLRLRAAWSFDRAGRPDRLCGTLVDCSALKAAGEERAMLLREADHRARNALAVTLAVLRLTDAADVASFRVAARERLAALARVEGLSDPARRGVPDLEGLLRAQVGPFVAGSQALDLRGAQVTLTAPLARLLALVLHELAVNALKHGALSCPGGAVSVTWRVLRRKDGRMLALRWTERGGPRIGAMPTRSGGGTALIQTVVAGRLGGTHATRFTRAGLRCEIRLPLR
jgi:two-component sensor histidine kinase